MSGMAEKGGNERPDHSLDGMEIEFSPSQIPAPRASTPIKGGSSSSGPTDNPPLQGMAELQRKLNDLALTRPEKLAAARPLGEDLKYPPEALLNSIAHLLAFHFEP
jgi:hypothetical protein